MLPRGLTMVPAELIVGGVYTVQVALLGVELALAASLITSDGV